MSTNARTHERTNADRVARRRASIVGWVVGLAAMMMTSTSSAGPLDDYDFAYFLPGATPPVYSPIPMSSRPDDPQVVDGHVNPAGEYATGVEVTLMDWVGGRPNGKMNIAWHGAKLELGIRVKPGYCDKVGCLVFVGINMARLSTLKFEDPEARVGSTEADWRIGSLDRGYAVFWGSDLSDARLREYVGPAPWHLVPDTWAATAEAKVGLKSSTGEYHVELKINLPPDPGVMPGAVSWDGHDSDPGQLPLSSHSAWHISGVS